MGIPVLIRCDVRHSPLQVRPETGNSAIGLGLPQCLWGRPQQSVMDPADTGRRDRKVPVPQVLRDREPHGDHFGFRLQLVSARIHPALPAGSIPWLRRSRHGRRTSATDIRGQCRLL